MNKIWCTFLNCLKQVLFLNMLINVLTYFKKVYQKYGGQTKPLNFLTLEQKQLVKICQQNFQKTKHKIPASPKHVGASSREKECSGLEDAPASGRKGVADLGNI